MVEFKAKSTSWFVCNLLKNNEVEFFDLAGSNRSSRSRPGLIMFFQYAMLGTRTPFAQAEALAPRNGV